MHRRSLRRPRALGALAVVLFAAACGGGGDGPTGTQPTPAQLQVVAGGGAQTALVGTPVPIVPSVRVISTAGAPMAGVTVAFTVTGGGSVGAASAQTNAEGVATPGSWTLGPAAGPNTLTARVGTLTANFSATATAVAPSPFLAASVETDGLAQCAVSTTGQLACWGRNTAALVGDGTTTFRDAPVAIALGGAPVAMVDVGFGNSCALTTAGAAWCWGLGPAVGSGATGAAGQSPTAVAGSHVFTKIAVGLSTACGLKANGEAWCWGGTAPDVAPARATPTLVSTTLRFRDVGAGARTTGAATDQACGIATTGTIHCWGITGIGDPAQVTIDAARAPTAIGGTTALVSLTLGRHHACGLTAAGAAWCWGRNDRGQVGDGTSANTRATPVAVSGGHTFARLVTGAWHSCGVTADGVAHCWGANDNEGQGGIRTPAGSLGNGTLATTPVTRPQPVVAPAGVRFAALSAGTATSCAVSTTSEVYCWGLEQTANPAFTNARPEPVRVLSP